MVIRKIKEILEGKESMDGAGVNLTRIFGFYNTKLTDPFLLLDFFDSTNPNDYISGFPWHPHRGIETVTYLVEGKIEHGDNLGNKGVINGGDCQWMTAGNGIIHQEMPKESKRMLGVQLWVNLPAEFKMTDPVYRDLTGMKIPSYDDGKMKVNVFSGKFNDLEGMVKGNFVKPTFLDVTLKKDQTFEYQVPFDYNVITFVMEGEIVSDNSLISRKMAAFFEDGDKVLINAKSDSRFLLLAAKRLNEPISWRGPIVMNTREEIELAFDELEKGTFIKKKIS